MKLTRGHGFLEGYLSSLRAGKADQLIPASLRRGRILDIGCGQFPFFLTKTEFREKYGIDKCASVEQQSFADRDVKFSLFDLEKDSRIPFNDSYFNVVTMLAVVEHMEFSKVLALWDEIFRVLKPGGYYILTTPAAWSDPLLRFMARLKLVSIEEIEEHKTLLTHEKIKQMMSITRFKNSGIKMGYFELYLNLWAVFTKP